LQSRLAALAQLPAGLAVTADPFRTMTSLRVRPEDAAADAVAGVLGVGLPTTPNTWIGNDAVTVVWLGVSGIDRLGTQEAELRAAVTPYGGAAVDVSGQRVWLRLSGVHVRDVLAKGCALDLHPRVFPPGRGAQSTVGRAGVILLADDDPGSFAVLVRQSFGNYHVDWLVDAAEEFRGE
jgi:sarcosine oxidase subunit gamma